MIKFSVINFLQKNTLHLFVIGTLVQSGFLLNYHSENIDLKHKNSVLKIENDDLKKRLEKANIALNFEKTERELRATVIDSCFIQKIESCLKCMQGTKK